jgi:hypothetical protein
MSDALPPAVAETHISYVFFVGDRAYKLKKPVRFEFVDLTSRDARERICHREVELNKRLSPDVYLGVLDIVDAAGRPVDHLVEMRRMPEELRLSALVARKAPTDACLRRLAHQLAAFHTEVPSTPEISRAGTPDAIRTLWDRSLTEMERFTGELLDAHVLDTSATLARRYVDGRTRLAEQRVADGRIRDGHGDLLADDIFCLPDGPRVLDCIEFDDRLRYGDVVADVAFLAMDLERLGAPELASRFLDVYKEFSGETYPDSLAEHYTAYRALVRSKVACLRYEQGDGAARDDARRLLVMAKEHLDRGRVRLVLVGGLPGTGKSTLAAALSDATGWSLQRSDEVRKDIAGAGRGMRVAVGYGHGIYTPEVTEATYAELLDRARRLLEFGETTILDASWQRRSHREAAAQIAAETSSDLIALRCVLPSGEAAERMARRRAEGSDVSDADASTAAAMEPRFDPWPGAIEISTAQTNEAVVARAIAATGR